MASPVAVGVTRPSVTALELNFTGKIKITHALREVIITV
jgi:hypothetical protein